MSASYPHPIIAREGWPFVAATVVVAAAAGWLIGWWSAPIWLAVLFVLQFFRDPPRQVPGDAHTVVSPADGRIVAVERARDPYLERSAIKVSVFMNVFNVHSNRSPVDGRVQKRWYHAGRVLNAAFDKASLENERNALWLRTIRGADVTCVQVTSAPRIVRSHSALRSFSKEALSKAALRTRPAWYQRFCTRPSTGERFECTLKTFMKTLTLIALRSR